MGEFEACLSDPWNVAFVARPQTIGISYIDGYGKYREEELSGWHAQVFQHEYDHLDGKTMAEIRQEYKMVKTIIWKKPND